MIVLTREKFARFLTHCPPGYEQAALAVATLTPETVELSPEAFAALQARFFPRPVPPAKKPLGLGDAVAAVATPIARALGLPCIDPATRQLRPESGCAQRKAALNRAVPKL